MNTPYLNDCSLICALGKGRDEVRRHLFADDAPTGVRRVVRPSGEALHLGVVETPLPSLDEFPLIHRSRNNALLLAALEEIRPQVEAAKDRFGPARVAVVLGTSTSGIGECEPGMAAYLEQGHFPDRYHYAQQEMGSPSVFLSQALQVSGPQYTLSTACSSCARALASAARMLALNLADAVVCGGADSLCDFTLAGFSSLELVSAERCNPMSKNRRGINIGEGAALFLMTREKGEMRGGVRLAGWGESSDAHHISAPDPSGRGAIRAMQQALDRANKESVNNKVDYINLHGTATLHNDMVEALAVTQVFGPDVLCSSTKPLTGHTLGAAGAIGAALCWLTLQDNPQHFLPPHWFDGEWDEAITPLRLVKPGERLSRPIKRTLCNTFAFGGNNASLLLEAVE